MTKKELVAALRELMQQNNVNAVYITGSDPHGSDGRYVAQMVRELDQEVFECINTSDPTSLSWTEWGCKNIAEGGVLAMDGEVLSYAVLRNLKIHLISTEFLSDMIKIFQVNFGQTALQFQMLLSGNWN